MKKLTNQKGFVSIIMALVVMIFVTLIALGFAFLARQNQEQAQNRQLSTQAFYAAESGVNDAVNFMTARLRANQPLPSATSCNDPQLTNNNYTPTIGNTNGNVLYTCVLYDAAPRTLEYTINTDNSQLVHLQNQNPARPLDTMTISWEDASGNTTYPSNTAANHHWLPQAGTNLPGGDDLSQNTGIVRATIIPIFNNITKADLLNKTQTIFLYPTSGAPNSRGTTNFPNTTNPGYVTQGAFANGSCNDTSLPRKCNVTITNLRGQGSTSNFYVRLKGIYRSSNVTISATDTSGGTARLISAQAVIDSTGKASNVLRRIQVRVPLESEFDRPEFSLESMESICKRYQLWPGGYNLDTTGINPIPGACQP